jgi:uncharacterized membrane protein YphA (DoxX/SURF4 family)
MRGGQALLYFQYMEGDSFGSCRFGMVAILRAITERSLGMNAVLLIVLKAVISLAFIFAGGAKLMKAKPLVDQFHDFHLPLEIMYLIGALEVLGAIALWVPWLTVWAFSGLACLMLGAIKSHYCAKHSVASMIPSAVLFCLCVGSALFVSWLGV